MNNPGKILLVLLLFFAAPMQAAVNIQVDRHLLTLGDSILLVIRANDGEDLQKVDLSPLRRDFDVLGSSQNTRHSFGNGRSESVTELQLSIEPKRVGSVLIPSLIVDGQQTRSISLQVSPASSTLDNSQDVFVEAEVDRSSVLVQAQLIYTFRIYQGVGLVERRRTPFELDGASIEELPILTFQRNVAGRNYMVTEIRYAIFPQKSGEMIIPSIFFTARESNGRRSLFDVGKSLRRQAESVTIQVKPIPAVYPVAPWLPAESLEIEDNWSAPLQALKVGDSLTRTITLKGRALTGAQLPPIEVEAVAGIKLYPDQPRAENSIEQDGVNALGISSTALVLTQAGDYEIPEIRLPWWNTNTDQLEYASIPAQRLRVAAAAPGPETTIPAAAAPGPVGGADSSSVSGVALATYSNPLWQWTTLAALLGWALTTWLLMRRRVDSRPATETVSASSESEKALFKSLASACGNHAGAVSRERLLAWGQCYFDLRQKPSMAQLDRALDDENLTQLLQSLEQSLYSSSPADWRGQSLISALESWRKLHRSRGKKPRGNALPPLYGH